MKLRGLVLWVAGRDEACRFYENALGLSCSEGGIRLEDGIVLSFAEPRPPCKARGPHGVVPALEVADIAVAKGWLQQLGRPIVFEEVVPGLARLTFLDPDGNPVDLVMPFETQEWERGRSISAVEASAPPHVRGLFEVSVYVRDLRAAVAFYRDTLGLETGLTYFAHLHLLFENAALVLRPTWVNCGQEQPHTPALVVEGPVTCEAPNAPFGPPSRVAVRHACWDGEHTWVLWLED